MVCAIPNTENVSFQYNFRTYYAHGVSHALSLRDDCVQNESEEAIGTQSDCNYQGIPGYLVKCDIENKINSFSMQDDDDSILQDSDLQVSYFQEEREAFVNNCKVQLLNSIIGDEFIDGEISRTEIIVKEMFKRGREAVMSALMDIYLEYFSEQDSHVLKGVLELLSVLPYEDVRPSGQIMALGVMRHKNKYVIKKGIQLYERWNSKEGIKIIKTLHFEEMRFQKYAEQVIEYLERDGV